MNKMFLFYLVCGITSEISFGQIPYPGTTPGTAIADILTKNSAVLENNVIKMTFALGRNRIAVEGFENKETKDNLEIRNKPLFKISLPDSSILTSDQFALQGPIKISNINPDANSKTYAERLGGKRFKAIFENKKIGLIVRWEAALRDSTNYIRQIFRFSAKDTVIISKISLIELPYNTGIEKLGKVDGSPIVNRNMFFALEHPMSQVEKNKASIEVSILQLTPITPGKNLTTSTVWGITSVNQLRRGFLYYLESERSTPYRQILHYNSWGDISWANTKFNEGQALDRIKMFKDSLITKRQVQLNAFLFDDGWDDNKTLWMFNTEGFQDGFTKLKEATKFCNSDLGVWMSPFGGYGNAKEKRLEFGKNQTPPFETNANGFSLTGPIYYNRFLNVARKFIKDYDISIFKFDGVGPGNDANGAGITYHNDIEAFLKLLKELKNIKPSLYLDLTTGTWPSPFWLMYGDNTWRSGDDNGLAGEGSLRQQGITYRDAITYKNVVEAGPLYPLNALMNGGIIIADNGLPGKFEMDDRNISDDIWSFFGSGVSLQELYINPHKLSTASWECLAKAISWVKENERVMSDIHWVGGDPAKGEVYGYAAWSAKRSVLMLRNPSKDEKSFQINVADIFEIPPGMKSNYILFDAKTSDKELFVQGNTFSINLQPFEVRIFNALPKQ